MLFQLPSGFSRFVWAFPSSLRFFQIFSRLFQIPLSFSRFLYVFPDSFRLLQISLEFSRFLQEFLASFMLFQVPLCFYRFLHYCIGEKDAEKELRLRINVLVDWSNFPPWGTFPGVGPALKISNDTWRISHSANSVFNAYYVLKWSCLSFKKMEHCFISHFLPSRLCFGR